MIFIDNLDNNFWVKSDILARPTTPRGLKRIVLTRRIRASAGIFENKLLTSLLMKLFIKGLFLLLRNYKIQPFFINSNFSSGRVI
jgi:hypothetical protein